MNLKKTGIMALAVLFFLVSPAALAFSFLGIQFAGGQIELGKDLPPPSKREWFDNKIDVMNQRGRGFGLVKAPAIENYLNRLFLKIKEASGVPDWPGSVYLLATPDLKAFATAAGNIYIGLNWLDSVESEDELVALLTHEFGHIYLHYHQIDGVVQSTDQLAGVAALGFALAERSIANTGWTNAMSMQAAYSVGRELGTSFWGKGQESAADRFGLNVSLKLGYSFEHGFKAMLERLATWEEENEKRRKKLEEEYYKAVYKSAEETTKQRNPQSPAPVAEFFGSLDGALAVALKKFENLAQQASNEIANKHPPIQERLDELAKLVDSNQGTQSDKEPVNSALNEIKNTAIFGQLMQNYKYAFEAMGSLGTEKALTNAEKALRGPTATHAYPAVALFRARMAWFTRGGRGSSLPNWITSSLDANLKSEPDRAWAVVLETVNFMIATGQRRDAVRFMASAWDYFGTSFETWPDSIRYTGELLGWDDAKKLAAHCVNILPQQYHAACRSAAMSPADKDAAKRKSEEDSRKLLEKLSGK